jgi:23S rRNA pseudouridine2605 synthase
VRLNRYLAAGGLGSRRACEAIITAGRVSINGHLVRELATTVSPGDSVKVDGRTVAAQETFYLLLNKPVGYVSSANDELGRQTVFDLLPPGLPRLFHVGRLDRDSEGLLLLTNDGAIAQKLTHPRHEVDKDYEVALNKEFDPADIGQLIKGIFIPVETPGTPAPRGGVAADGDRVPQKAASVPRTAPGKPGTPSPVRHVRAKATAVKPMGGRKVRITLQQGLKRQVRLMMYELGYEVETLRRVRLGPLTLGKLLPGRWRELTSREIAALNADEK